MESRKLLPGWIRKNKILSNKDPKLNLQKLKVLQQGILKGRIIKIEQETKLDEQNLKKSSRLKGFVQGIKSK